MPCYRVFPAQYDEREGKLKFHDSGFGRSIRLPCGRCFGCRMDRVKSWSVRCQHEASCWDFNSFVTLTYDESHVPWDGGLRSVDVQRWLKRLRKVLPGAQDAPGGGRPLRFFLAGEYGERTQRPHYHALLFNAELPKERQVGKDLFETDVLSSTWGLGSVAFGDVTPASASYVAGYSLKKVYGSRDRQSDHYGVMDPDTGEWCEREREFCRMSLRPGIGQFWFDRFKRDLVHGFVVRDGQKFGVPRYYRSKLRQDEPSLYEQLEWSRAQFNARADLEERSEERLAAAERVAVARRAMYR